MKKVIIFSSLLIFIIFLSGCGINEKLDGIKSSIDDKTTTETIQLRKVRYKIEKLNNSSNPYLNTDQFINIYFTNSAGTISKFENYNLLQPFNYTVTAKVGESMSLLVENLAPTASNSQIDLFISSDINSTYESMISTVLSKTVVLTVN